MTAPRLTGTFTAGGTPAFLADDTFEKIHLAITRGDFARQKDIPRTALRQKLGYPQETWQETGYLPLRSDNEIIMQLMQVDSPTYELFMHQMRAVGGNYGWHLRKKYQGEEGRNTVETMLRDRETTMFIFQVINLKENTTQNVGFTLVAGIHPDRAATRGIGKNEVIDRMITDRIQKAKNREISHTDLTFGASRVEIYKFGMNAGFTGQGYGHYFLPKVLEKLLRRYDIVYLDTRSTNPPETIKFYERNGLSIIHREVLPSDIVLDAELVAQPALPPVMHPVNGGPIGGAGRAGSTEIWIAGDRPANDWGDPTGLVDRFGRPILTNKFEI